MSFAIGGLLLEVDSEFFLARSTDGLALLVGCLIGRALVQDTVLQCS